jgi:hypothetical protein
MWGQYYNKLPRNKFQECDLVSTQPDSEFVLEVLNQVNFVNSQMQLQKKNRGVENCRDRETQ